jgi:hypothetical protein
MVVGQTREEKEMKNYEKNLEKNLPIDIKER